MSVKVEYYDVICKLIIIEKLIMVLENGVVVFEVLIDLNKLQIKEVVEVLFGVKVKVVNIVVIKGKVKCFCGIFGKCVDVKKVYVILEEGNIIDVIIGF